MAALGATVRPLLTGLRWRSACRTAASGKPLLQRSRVRHRRPLLCCHDSGPAGAGADADAALTAEHHGRGLATAGLSPNAGVERRCGGGGASNSTSSLSAARRLGPP